MKEKTEPTVLHKKDFEKFTFTVEYESEENGAEEKRFVYVKLEIDHRRNEFSILNQNGRPDFQFSVTSGRYKMWQAVLKCINEAIEFANKRLEGE